MYTIDYVFLKKNYFLSLLEGSTVMQKDLQIIIILIILIILIVLLFEIVMNWDHILQYLRSKSHSNNIQTTPNIIDNVADHCNRMNVKATFIDVGSGDGNFLSKIVNKTYFTTYIGIENDPNGHEIASNMKLEDVQFINADVLNVDYRFITTPIVLYLYEPFFFYGLSTKYRNV